MHFLLIIFRGQAPNWQHNPLGKTDGPAVLEMRQHILLNYHLRGARGPF